MTAEMFADPEGRALVAAIHERKTGPCRCWTEPARVHAGHCCMATAGQTCHQTEGLTAHQEGTQ